MQQKKNTKKTMDDVWIAKGKGLLVTQPFLTVVVIVGAANRWEGANYLIKEITRQCEASQNAEMIAWADNGWRTASQLTWDLASIARGRYFVHLRAEQTTTIASDFVDQILRLLYLNARADVLVCSSVVKENEGMIYRTSLVQGLKSEDWEKQIMIKMKERS